MGSLLSWALSPAGKAVSIVAAGLIFGGTLYSAGKYVGRQQAKIEQLQSDVAAEVKRKGIDHEVDSLDRYRICIDLGGLRDQCEQLRRLAAAAETE